MKKAIRNFIIGAAMALGIFGASTAALADTQYVQTSMNFRSAPSTTANVIGSIPEGSSVDVLDSQNGWNLVRFNGVTGYIHGGNVAYTYTPAPKASTANVSSQSTKNYYDNGFSQAAYNVVNDDRTVRTVYVTDGYLALRSYPSYDDSNVVGQLYTGDTVELISNTTDGSYVQVFAPRLGLYGYVNAGFLA